MKVEVFHSGVFTSSVVVSTIQFGGRGIGFEGVVSRRVGLLGVNCKGFHRWCDNLAFLPRSPNTHHIHRIYDGTIRGRKNQTLP
jgi:hypothetical protein